jgi:hypothetical protein
VVDDLIRIKLEQLGRLRSRLLNREEVIDLRCERILSGDPNGENKSDRQNRMPLRELVELRLESLSWSDVVDYSRLPDFHDVAQRLRAKQHYGYSVNWPTVVVGASLVDYLAQHQDSEPCRVQRVLTKALKEPSSSESRHPLLPRPLLDTPL